jgi:hypothetical protein
VGKKVWFLGLSYNHSDRATLGISKAFHAPDGGEMKIRENVYGLRKGAFGQVL